MPLLNQNRTYLDYAASTPLDPNVAAAMANTPGTGNPSSIHTEGLALRALVDTARANVARLLEVSADRITFTSGATEANTMAVLGAVRAARAHTTSGTRPLRIMVSALEHASVARAAELAASEYNAEVHVIATDKNGIVQAEDVRAAIDERTVLVCCMWANNVLGSVQPVADIGALVATERASRGTDGLPIAFMTDAVQAVRTLPVLPNAVGADLVSISSHKLYGPKGVGALFVRAGTTFAPLVAGGGQERGLRGGTENVASIVGFGEAAALLRTRRMDDRAHMEKLRRALVTAITKQCGDRVVVLGGADDAAADGTALSDIVFLHARGTDAEGLVIRLDAAGFAVSAGSACDSGKRKPASVVRTVYGDRIATDGGIRASFGRGTDEGALRAFVEALAAAIARR